MECSPLFRTILHSLRIILIAIVDTGNLTAKCGEVGILCEIRNYVTVAVDHFHFYAIDLRPWHNHSFQSRWRTCGSQFMAADLFFPTESHRFKRSRLIFHSGKTHQTTIGMYLASGKLLSGQT